MAAKKRLEDQKSLNKGIKYFITHYWDPSENHRGPRRVKMQIKKKFPSAGSQDQKAKEYRDSENRFPFFISSVFSSIQTLSPASPTLH